MTTLDWQTLLAALFTYFVAWGVVEMTFLTKKRNRRTKR